MLTTETGGVAGGRSQRCSAVLRPTRWQLTPRTGTARRCGRRSLRSVRSTSCSVRHTLSACTVGPLASSSFARQALSWQVMAVMSAVRVMFAAVKSGREDVAVERCFRASSQGSRTPGRRWPADWGYITGVDLSKTVFETVFGVPCKAFPGGAGFGGFLDR